MHWRCNNSVHQSVCLSNSWSVSIQLNMSTNICHRTLVPSSKFSPPLEAWPTMWSWERRSLDISNFGAFWIQICARIHRISAKSDTVFHATVAWRAFFDFNYPQCKVLGLTSFQSKASAAKRFLHATDVRLPLHETGWLGKMVSFKVIAAVEQKSGGGRNSIPQSKQFERCHPHQHTRTLVR